MNFFDRMKNGLYGSMGWRGCRAQTTSERLAQWQIKYGHKKAQKIMQAEKVRQMLDMRAARRARVIA